jgi:H(+)-transporting ATP synthase subunit D
VKLRASLAFVNSALTILKLKRDRLAEELNLLLEEMVRRDKAEQQMMAVYADFKVTLAMYGTSEVSSNADSIGKMKIAANSRSVMNALVPTVEVRGRPDISIIEEASLYQVAQKMQILVEEWFKIAGLEASIERIANELTLVNRKVNAIEKALIPTYQAQVNYIEGFLSDEELEDFTRIKHIKTVSGKDKT